MSQKLPLIARILLGLVFTVFGLNFFLHFLPTPALGAEAGAFLGALVGGKILTVAKIIELVTGLALLAGRFVPLALTVLAPVVVGIVLFHAVFDPGGLVIPLVLAALNAYLGWAYRGSFAPMLASDAQPTK